MMCFCRRWAFAKFCEPFKNVCEIDLRADVVVASSNCQAQKRSFKICWNANPCDVLQIKLKLRLFMSPGSRGRHQVMGALGIVTFILFVAELYGMDHCNGKLRVRIVSFSKWLEM